MNAYDEKQKNDLLQALLKAKEKAELVVLYLTANNGNMDDIFNARLALEHIEIALEHLGAAVEA